MSEDFAHGPIVVGVDSSERSRDALTLADELAPLLESPVLSAWVDSRSDSDAAPPSIDGREVEAVVNRSPAEGLQHLAEREAASLLVVGSSHRSRLGRVLPGGTAELLLAGSPAPVAVAPAGYAGSQPWIRRVGCAFDGSPESHHALAWAAQVARTASAPLTVIGVHEPLPATTGFEGGPAIASLREKLRAEREKEIRQAAAAQPSDLDVRAELLDGDPGDVLATRSHELDLLVLGSRGYGPLRAVLLGSVSFSLVRSAKAPIVVTPRGMGEKPHRRSELRGRRWVHANHSQHPGS